MKRIAEVWAVLLVTSLCVIPTGTAAGQTQVAITSKLSGISLPQGAERIPDPKTVEQATAPLAKIAADMGTPMRLQAMEVIGWGGAGSGYDRQKGTRVIAQVRAALDKAGYHDLVFHFYPVREIQDSGGLLGGE
jgi:hypothetical protein